MEEVKNYYEDLPETEFVPLEFIGDKFKGLYEINKLGQFRKKLDGLILSTKSLNANGYPTVNLIDINSVRHVFQVHRLLAGTFIPNPNNLPSVDHINRVRTDFSLSNLRWLDWSGQAKNQGNKQVKNFMYAKIDDSGNEVTRINTQGLSKEEIRKIAMAAHRNRKYEGFRWKLIDLDVEEYLKTHPLPINDGEWVPCLRLPDVLECTKSGYFRFIQYKTKRVTVGHKNGGEYLTFHINNKAFFAHRLIYETFTGKLLESSIDVGHKDTNRSNNEFSNLEACTRKQNMNNYLTRQKSMKRIKQFSLKGEYIRTFDSLKSASEEIDSCVDNYRNNRGNIVSGFMWCLEGEEYQIEDIINNGIFKYDKDKNKIDWFLNPTEASRNSTAYRKTIKKAAETGNICSDGFYYSRGPRIWES